MWYVSGYVFRKLRDHIQSSCLSNKDNMISALMQLAKDEMDEQGGTEDWVNLIDRGGLWHINNDTYDLFVTLEYEIQRFFNVRDILKWKQRRYQEGGCECSSPKW